VSVAPVVVSIPDPPYDHLLRLGDHVGVFEHARGLERRTEHGYCTDDVARALVAILREPRRTGALAELGETCFEFILRAQLPDGRFHNRYSVEREWLDEAGPDDTTGRALLALAVAASRAASSVERETALRRFELGADFCSSWLRSSASAAIAASEALRVAPENRYARRLLATAATGLGIMGGDPGWPWPESRLSYGNALLAEAWIAAGAAAGDMGRLEDGLRLLAWLLHTETRAGHFSFTPAGGWGRLEPRPAFDQQPIEAAAMADACARAFDVTGDRQWADAVLLAAAWFLGDNDVGVPLLDEESGGCRDGLERDGCNENQGAESTIAMITTLQHARRFRLSRQAARSAPTISRASTSTAPTQRSAAPYVR
jgi:hypothetical protein